MATLVDSNGIFTEIARYPTNDAVADMFKGVFVRNLVYLQGARADDAYVAFLQKNAVSIWQNDWDGDGLLGPDWQGPVENTLAQAQSSGLDCLVAAAAAVS
ncbi:hypothetical protein LTR53_018967 [Teratosphaeriaceae sp. CCFEE 6253]|nr:hypothetical protein LTR53_018967 [Teratosphaeriaceae sp. CCFEE 6253]